jgi:glycine/D-amino acid oxidase-like deaminating enzyme
MYRVATSEGQARVLRDAATADGGLSGVAEWIPEYGAHGALRLHSGCQVVHVPSYLRGLWKACRDKVSSGGEAGRSARWVILASTNELFETSRLQQHDAVVFSAGAGLFASDSHSPALSRATSHLPVQLVRGQSLVVSLSSADAELRDAVLCGKYLSPLPQAGEILVGATHEFQPTPWTAGQVLEDLRGRTSGCLAPDLAASVWERGRVRRVTQGVRVQSARGRHGRLPLVGRLDAKGLHPNAWLFTGLSSRGLLYHAWYGDWLARAVLADSEDVATVKNGPTDLLWWKPTVDTSRSHSNEHDDHSISEL